MHNKNMGAMLISRHLMSRGIAILLLFIFLIVLNGCKPKHESELYGTYIADYEIAKEKIILFKNGTYFQEVNIKSLSRIVTAKGKWLYNSSTGYLVLNENHIVVLDESGKLNPLYDKPDRGPGYLPVDKYLCWIVLGVVDGVIYKKVN